MNDEKKPEEYTLEDLTMSPVDRLRFELAATYPSHMVEAGVKALKNARPEDVEHDPEMVVRFVLASVRMAQGFQVPEFIYRDERLLGLFGERREVDDVLERLQDEAYLHRPSCPRLVGRECAWCAEEGVLLAREAERRQREFWGRIGHPVWPMLPFKPTSFITITGV